MEFHIILDSPYGPEANAPPGSFINRYLPGQRVSGKIHLLLREDSDIPNVSIRFRGKVKTTLPNGNDNTRYYEYTIFTYEKSVFKGGKFKMRATKYEWPFEFRFPETFTMQGLAATQEFELNENYTTIGKQQLPPTMSTSHGRRSALVAYKLKARVQRSFLDWKTEKYLNLMPARLEASPDPREVMQRSPHGGLRHEYRYDDNFIPRELSTKESFKDMFRSSSKSKTKTIAFNVSVTAPTVFVIGKSGAISVTVSTAPTDMVEPDFQLTAIRAELLSRTEVRTPGTFGDHYGSMEDDFPLCDKVGLSFNLEKNRSMKIGGVFPKERRQWLGVTPTFSTMAAMRWYVLKIKLRIRCLEKEFSLPTYSWSNVSVLPARMNEGIEEAAEMIRSGNFNIPSPEERDGPSRMGAIMGESAEVTGAPPYTQEDAPPIYKETQNT